MRRFKTLEAPITLPKPVIFDMFEVNVPLLIRVVKVVEIVESEGSVELVLTLSVIVEITVVDPLKTPTILTLKVSTMFKSAQRLLMKLVVEELLLKKSLIFIAK